MNKCDRHKNSICVVEGFKHFMLRLHAFIIKINESFKMNQKEGHVLSESLKT
jgi:hypothetical protein